MARGRHAVRNRLLALLPALLLAVAVAALPTVLGHAAPGARDAYVREALSRGDVFDAAWRVRSFGVVAGVLVLAAWPRRRDGTASAGGMAHAPARADGDIDIDVARAGGAGAWPRLAAAGVLCAWALVGLLLPAVAELQQGPVKRAALLARQAGWPVRSWRIDAPSFSVYRAAPTPAADTPRPGDILLTRSDALAGLGPVRVLFREGGVLLVRVGG